MRRLQSLIFALALFIAGVFALNGAGRRSVIGADLRAAVVSHAAELDQSERLCAGEAVVVRNLRVGERVELVLPESEAGRELRIDFLHSFLAAEAAIVSGADRSGVLAASEALEPQPATVSVKAASDGGVIVLEVLSKKPPFENSITLCRLQLEGSGLESKSLAIAAAAFAAGAGFLAGSMRLAQSLTWLLILFMSLLIETVWFAGGTRVQVTLGFGDTFLLHAVPALILLSSLAAAAFFSIFRQQDIRDRWVRGVAGALLVVIEGYGSRYAATTASGVIILIAALAAVNCIQPWLQEMPDSRQQEPPQLPRFAGLLSAAVLLLLAAAAAFCRMNERTLLGDSLLHLHYAESLTRGELFASFHSAAGVLVEDLIVRTNHGWLPITPPGFHILLAGAALLGAPLLLSPIAAACAVWFAQQGLKKVLNEFEIRLYLLLAPSTLALIFIASEPLAHAAVMALAMGLLAMKLTGRGAALTYGAVLGALFTLRPYDALLAGIALLAVSRISFGQSILPGIKTFLLAGAGFLPFAAALGVYNHMINGAPHLFSYLAVHGSAHLPGLGISPYGVPHGPAEVLERAGEYVALLDYWLIGWFPAPLLLAAFGASSRVVVLAAAWLLPFLIGYSLYWHIDDYIGPRYLACAIPILLILVVEPLAKLGAKSMRSAALLILVAAGLQLCLRGVPELLRG